MCNYIFILIIKYLYPPLFEQIGEKLYGYLP